MDCNRSGGWNKAEREPATHCDKCRGAGELFPGRAPAGHKGKWDNSRGPGRSAVFREVRRRRRDGRRVKCRSDRGHSVLSVRRNVRTTSACDETRRVGPKGRSCGMNPALRPPIRHGSNHTEATGAGAVAAGPRRRRLFASTSFQSIDFRTEGDHIRPTSEICGSERRLPFRESRRHGIHLPRRY
jgi:hypothetical protein